VPPSAECGLGPKKRVLTSTINGAECQRYSLKFKLKAVKLKVPE